MQRIKSKQYGQKLKILSVTGRKMSLSDSNARFINTRWFKYDRDYLCVNLATSVPVMFEPTCIFIVISVAVKRTDFIKELEVHNDLIFFPSLCWHLSQENYRLFVLNSFSSALTRDLFCTVLSLLSNFSISLLFRSYKYYFTKVEK